MKTRRVMLSEKTMYLHRSGADDDNPWLRKYTVVYRCTWSVSRPRYVIRLLSEERTKILLATDCSAMLTARAFWWQASEIAYCVLVTVCNYYLSVKKYDIPCASSKRAGHLHPPCFPCHMIHIFVFTCKCQQQRENNLLSCRCNLTTRNKYILININFFSWPWNEKFIFKTTEVA